MKMGSLLIGAMAAGMAGAILAGGGCGVLTAPFSVPEAVAENANFSFQGKVVDVNGQPLDSVLMSQQLDHHFWTPVAGGTDTDEHHLRRVDGGFDVEERGRELNLTFTRDGYYDATYTINSGDAKSVHTRQGDWPVVPDFPVVMLSRTPADAHLQTWNQNLQYAAYPRQAAIDLSRLGGQPAVTLDGSAASFDTVRPGVLYITLTKQPPGTKSNGDVDPTEVNLPAHLELHLSGAENGLLRIVPRVGYPPVQTADTAPRAGYSPTLELSRDRLKQMRMADDERIIEAHEYFYFLAQGHYGKGMISWSQSYRPGTQGVLPLSFTIGLWEQPAAGDDNLRAHGTECTCH